MIISPNRDPNLKFTSFITADATNYYLFASLSDAILAGHTGF